MTRRAFRVSTLNVQKDADRADVRAAIEAIAKRADLVFWQEIETSFHRQVIDGLDEFETYWPGGSANAVPISHRKSRFKVARRRITRRKRQGRHKLHRGQKGNTPDRWCIVKVLVDLETGRQVAAQNTHLIQQAWTTKPTNRPRWNKGAEKVTRISQRLIRTVGALVGGADTNRDKWAPPGTDGHWSVGPTHGSRFYDVIFTAGKAQLMTRYAGRINHPGLDHDELTGLVEVMP